MAGDKKPVKAIKANQLAAMLQGQKEKVLIIDCRPLVDYHILHVLNAASVCTSKIMAERESLTEPLKPSPTVMIKGLEAKELVLYDQEAKDPPASDIIAILLQKLEKQFNNVYFLKGGFVEFSSCFPSLCEGKSHSSLPNSISQPCLSTCDMGPTQILPYFYLGSQNDVLNKEVMVQNGISHILNVSSNCPKPAFIPDSHFLRIPVNDSYCDSLLPWLNKSVEFIDTVRSMKCRVLVHCLAGISRSAAIAIAYIMRTMDFSLDDAYRFVKDRRPSISPNFNFLGQLVEYEKAIRRIPASAYLKQSLLHPENTPTKEGISQPENCEESDEDVEIFIPRFSTQTFPEHPGLLDKGTGNDTGSIPRNLGKGPPELADLQRGLTDLRLSPERTSHTSCMKRSFSLDVKSAYSSTPRFSCCQAAQPAETGPVPKLLGFQSKLVAGTFNPFTLLFGNARKGHWKDGATSNGATRTLNSQQKCSCLKTASPVVGIDQGPIRSPCVIDKEDSVQNHSTTGLTLSLPVPRQPSSPLLDYSACLITMHGKRTELSLFEHPYSGPADCKSIKPSHVTRNVGLYTDNMVKS
ncbi:dual specificity protein phosphatase 8-like [Heterodontus francisci]|uniref:dual specificity protein phosphatase 8-like n=1 Tax=Heterodontus francisci TaxID=7792 RepID=UPI00355C9BCC